MLPHTTCSFRFSFSNFKHAISLSFQSSFQRSLMVLVNYRCLPKYLALAGVYLTLYALQSRAMHDSLADCYRTQSDSRADRRDSYPLRYACSKMNLRLKADMLVNTSLGFNLQFTIRDAVLIQKLGSCLVHSPLPRQSLVSFLFLRLLICLNSAG